MTTHEFTGERLLNGKRAYGPNSGRQSLVIGRLADRVHTKSLANAQQPVPLAQRNVPTPQSIGSAGHVWLLAYADGHCSNHQADEEIGEELGNWRCFANENTHLLGRGGLSDDRHGASPILVSHDEDRLMLWDARPGIVTDPMRVTVADDGGRGHRDEPPSRGLVS